MKYARNNKLTKEFAAEVIHSFAEKGWGLYRSNFSDPSHRNIDNIIRGGPATEILIFDSQPSPGKRFSGYNPLPMGARPSDPPSVRMLIDYIAHSGLSLKQPSFKKEGCYYPVDFFHFRESEVIGLNFTGIRAEQPHLLPVVISYKYLVRSIDRDFFPIIRPSILYPHPH